MEKERGEREKAPQTKDKSQLELRSGKTKMQVQGEDEARSREAPLLGRFKSGFGANVRGLGHN